ncbi:MAG: alpha/beta fold hydrolase [Acidimicrobiales bacterium]
MAFAELDGVRLFYTDEGSGDPPLLLVHGWTCDSHDWTFQLDDFTAAHRVIAPDIRGHGRSSVPEHGYRPRVFADDLAGLLHRLGAEPVVAVGHSLGTLIVSALAVEHPELIRAVVVVDPAYGLGGELAGLLGDTAASMRGPEGLGTAAGLFAQLDGSHIPPALSTWHRRRLLGMPPEVMAETFSGIFAAEDQFAVRPAADAYLRRRECPVLAFHTDPAKAAWEAGIVADASPASPHSRSVTWGDAGHWLHQERPSEFNATVLEWVAALAP